MGKKKAPTQKDKGQTLTLAEFAGDAAAADPLALPTAPREDDGCAAAHPLRLHNAFVPARGAAGARRPRHRVTAMSPPPAEPLQSPCRSPSPPSAGPRVDEGGGLRLLFRGVLRPRLRGGGVSACAAREGVSARGRGACAGARARSAQARPRSAASWTILRARGGGTALPT